MLPNLSKLVVKRRRADDDIYFKAFRSGEYRKLSNLFGPVEWMYQQAKFKRGSEVYLFLEEGKQKTLQGSFTRQEFAATLIAMGHSGKLESYIDVDGALATGLIAQMTSQIAKVPDSDLARKRLSLIMQRNSKISTSDALAWHAENVHPALNDEEANARMARLLMEKYAIPMYRELLLRSDTRVLHEGKGRGAPNKWEWQEKPLSPDQEARGFTRGGDVLGQLLMQVRQKLQELPQMVEPPFQEKHSKGSLKCA